jgi:hypothetical protein
MICDIAKGSVNRSSVLIVTFTSMGTQVVTLENSIATTQRTLWNRKAMPYFKETSISFF